MKSLATFALGCLAIVIVVAAHNQGAPKPDGVTAPGLVAALHYGMDLGVCWDTVADKIEADELKSFDDVNNWGIEKHAAYRKHEFGPLNVFRDIVGPKWDKQKAVQAAREQARKFKQ